MIPIRYDGETAVFSLNNINDYGMPEQYGYENYIVIDSAPKYVTDYKLEQEREYRNIHRYSRLDRFKSTFFQLIGDRGDVPSHVLGLVESFLKPDSENLWEDTRKILKHFRLRKWYDRIPKILDMLGHGQLFEKMSGEDIETVITDFKTLSTSFEQNKQKYKRRYFPNIRYIVFKILKLNGFEPRYKVPFVRTSRKEESLNELWSCLIKDFIQ
jgi:hypothetical protein